MESRQVSRRFVVTALGSGIALAPVIARSTFTQSPSATPEPLEEGSSDVSKAPSLGAKLIAPLRVGSTIGGATLLNIGELEQGAIGLVMKDQAGNRFGIEICARDEASPRSPGVTEKFQLYVVNEGDGSLPTIEEHGLAAMNIAAIIRRNEESVDTTAFLTLDQRLARHASEITRPA